jgi:hypothetical protein
MIFQVVLTSLKAQIFPTPPAFHVITIGNHALKIISCIDIAISLLDNVVMNKIIGVSIIN